MPRTIRRTIVVTAAVGALLATGAGLAYADDGDDDGADSGATSASQPATSGTGNGLSGGPTYTQVLKAPPRCRCTTRPSARASCSRRSTTASPAEFLASFPRH